MRKRIGLVIGEINQHVFICGLINTIRSELARYGMDLFVFANFGTYEHDLYLYAEGEKSIRKLLDSDSFYGFIVDETMFHIEGMAGEVYTFLSERVKCPVVYLKTHTEKFPGVFFSDKEAMKTATEYFIKEHGFTDICHMAGRWDLEDAHDRYEGYLEAMNENNIPVDDTMVFHGNYWKTMASQAIDYFLESRGEKCPQAICCANDYMALSLIEELTKRGYRVPEDVCISGYDNIDESQAGEVTLTTFTSDHEEIGKKAVELILRMDNGEDVPKENFVSNRMIIRESTDKSLKNKHDNGNPADTIAALRRHYYGMDMLCFLNAGYDVSFEENEIFQRADYYFRYTSASKGYLFLTDDAFDAMSRRFEKINDFTDSIILKRVFYSDGKTRYESPDKIFDRRQLIPEEYMIDDPSTYYVFPIHAQNKVYGYMVTVYEDNDFPNKFTQSYTSMLANALENYNVRHEYMDVEEMKRAYLGDPLTGVYNRRGFENQLEILSERAKRRKLHLSVVSIDMDGLKGINDNYGHAEGDASLAEFANILLSVLKNDEVCARYGGDEFAALLISDDANRHLRFIPDLENAMERANQILNKPYLIHASSGVVCVDDYPDMSVSSCVKEADKIMYDNKVAYKKQRGEEVR